LKKWDLASSPNNQLATMKANLTLLEESVGTFSETIKAQRNFVLEILGNITQQNQSYPTNRF
jgi:hypothetical protein